MIKLRWYIWVILILSFTLIVVWKSKNHDGTKAIKGMKKKRRRRTLVDTVRNELQDILEIAQNPTQLLIPNRREYDRDDEDRDDEESIENLLPEEFIPAPKNPVNPVKPVKPKEAVKPEKIVKDSRPSLQVIQESEPQIQNDLDFGGLNMIEVPTNAIEDTGDDSYNDYDIDSEDDGVEDDGVEGDGYEEEPEIQIRPDDWFQAPPPVLEVSRPRRQILYQSPKPQKNGNPRKSESHCRKILEQLFGVPFPSIWPDWCRNPLTNRKLEIDCYNADLRIGLEFQGKQHYVYPNAFHKNKKEFWAQRYRDKVKEIACQKMGVWLIRVPYSEPPGKRKQFILERLPPESHYADIENFQEILEEI